MRRWTCLFLASTLLDVLACQGKTGTSLPAEESAPATSPREIDLGRLGRDRQTSLRALRMSHRAVAARLGAHKISCRSSLETTLPGTTPQRVDQEVTLQRDAQGRFSAVKTTHPQYGNEVIWTGEFLFPRLRYGKFLKRRARPEEPLEIADRMVGLLPAYVRLLGRFLAVEPDGTARFLGREVVRVKLALAPSPAPPAPLPGAARRWRQSIVAKEIQGQALLDAKSGAPLSVDLRARYTFSPPAGPPPAATGIPGSMSSDTVATTRLTFTQRIGEIGAVGRITPPPENETIDNPVRVRLEIERQILSGELPGGGDP
jgi:hypothetical protein